MGIATFEGKPCVRCGSTARYVLRGNCVACTRVRGAKRAPRVEYRTKYYADNGEIVRAKARISYIVNHDREMERAARWRTEHGDRARAATARWQAAHPNERRAYKVQYQADKPEMHRADSQRRRARKRGATIGPVDEAQVFVSGICYLCRLPIDMNLKYPDPMSKSVDHIEPLARGGTHTMDNLAPAHWLCNVRKGTKIL
jgi:hypothetical protein